MKNLFTYPSNTATAFINPTYYAAVANATQIETGLEYMILTVGTTDFTAIGASSNTVGLQFTANSTTPAGTGTVHILDTGMLGKFNAIGTGLYKAFPITYWGTANHTTRLSNCSKFINYFNDDKFGTNLSIYDFFRTPLTVFSKSAYNIAASNVKTTVTSLGQPIWQVTHATAAHIDDNNQVDFSADPANGNLHSGTKTDFFVDAVGDTVARLYTTSLGGASPQTYSVGISSVRHNRGMGSGSIGEAMFIKTSTGLMLVNPLNAGKTDSEDAFSIYDSSTPDKLAFFAKDGSSSGRPFDTNLGSAERTTSIQTDDVLYGTQTGGLPATQQGYTMHTLDIFTNSDKTTHPTHTEEYMVTLTKTFSNTSTASPLTVRDMTNDILINGGGYTFNFNGTVSSSTGTAPLLPIFAAENDTSTGPGYMLARVTVADGTAVGSSTSAGFDMNTSLNYNDLWYVTYDTSGGTGNEKINVTKKINNTATTFGGQRVLAGVVSGQPAPTATVTIQIIDPAKCRIGSAETTFMSKESESTSIKLAKRVGGTPTLNKHFISGKTDILGPGQRVYSFQNTSNVTAFGARFSGTYYEDNGSQGTSQTLTTNKTPTIAINVDGTGRLTGYGTLGTINDKVGGVWDNGNAVVLPIDSAADTYAPRTPSTVETDETFDTDDYWVNPAFPEGHESDKAFPLDIIPARATVTYVQPSTTNVTQSGKKFVRSSQFVKYKLQVEYAPMRVDDFRKIQKCVLAAQGQSQPFYFPLRYSGGIDILMSDGSVTPSTEFINVTKLADQLDGQSIFTVGGFEQNETDALKDGEHFIIFNDNGNLAMVVSGHDANNFGEVKFRISHPTSTKLGFGTKFFKNPSHAIVTLAQDEFEYNVDEQELYYVTVNFDLDQFK